MTVIEDITLIRSSSSSDNTPPFKGCGCINKRQLPYGRNCLFRLYFCFCFTKGARCYTELTFTIHPYYIICLLGAIIRKNKHKNKKDCLHAVLRVISSSCFFSHRISVMLNYKSLFIFQLAILITKYDTFILIDNNSIFYMSFNCSEQYLSF